MVLSRASGVCCASQNEKDGGVCAFAASFESEVRRMVGREKESWR